MARLQVLASWTLGVAAVAFAGTPSNKTRISAQASEKSVEDEIAEERTRLHTSVQKAMPASHERSTVNMWKTARPSAAKVQAAAAVVAGDWADADNSSENHATSKKTSAYDSNANAVEEERASMHKNVQSVPTIPEKSTATKWKTNKPAAAKVQAATEAAAEDWANADNARQVASPTAAKAPAAKVTADEAAAASKSSNAPSAAESADLTVKASKPGSKKAGTAAAVLDGGKAPQKVDEEAAKKVASNLRKHGRH